MGILDFLKSGTPPKEQRGKGGAGTITGRQMPPEKSVKEKKSAKRKAMFEKKTVKKKDQLYSRKYSPRPKTKKFKTITSKESGIPDSQPFSKGGMAQGYGRAAMRPGKDPRTISKT